MRVIIVNYNAGALLAECLGGLKAQSYGNFEVVVADNASADGSLAAVDEGDRRFRVLRLSANLGFAAANNRAAALQSEGGTAEAGVAAWLALLNPDAVPEPEWLAELVAATRRHPGADMFGSTQIDARDPGRLDGAGDCFFALGLPWRGGFGHPVDILPPEGEVFAPCAAAALYRTALFEALGGFDEDFFCYYEDVDFAFRARLANAHCIQVPSARVRHYGSAIAGRHSDFSQFHSARNRLWLFAKNMPAPLALLLLPGLVALQTALIGWAGARGHGGAVWRGTLAGVGGLGAALAKRRTVQAARRAGWRDIARAMSWSPRRVLSRAPDVRPQARAAGPPDDPMGHA